MRRCVCVEWSRLSYKFVFAEGMVCRNSLGKFYEMSAVSYRADWYLPIPHVDVELPGSNKRDLV